MAFFGLFGDNNTDNKNGSTKIQSNAMPVMPEEIYEAAALELKDIIAPAALQIQPKSINLCDLIPSNAHRQLALSDNQPRQNF